MSDTAAAAMILCNIMEEEKNKKEGKKSQRDSMWRRAKYNSPGIKQTSTFYFILGILSVVAFVIILASFWGEIPIWLMLLSFLLMLPIIIGCITLGYNERRREKLRKKAKEYGLKHDIPIDILHP